MASKKRRGVKKAKSAGSVSDKIKLVLKNLFIFLALFVVSRLVFNVVSNEFWESIFFLLSIIFGFVALAFFIAWLVLVLLKSTRK